MNNVMTQSKAKDDWLQIRIDPELKVDVKITADARGLSVSALVHSMLKQAVRDEKQQYPHLFQRPAPVVARISSERAEIQHQFEQGIPLATASKTKLPLAKNTQEKKRKSR